MGFELEHVPSQKGKIAIVTGANIGLGYETALALAKKEVKVIMACRNLEKAEKAKTKIEQQLPAADLVIIQLDLNSLQSVRDFAKEYLAAYDRLDILIENAGIMIPPLMQTIDGFESQIGVNYFSHFLLTNLLFPVLKNTPGARVVTLSSIAHKRGKIDFDNLNAEKSYSKMAAYGQSKLACLMFALELQRRIEAADIKNVIATSAHPGVANTNLSQYIPKLVTTLALPLMSIISHSVANGALPSLYAALGTNVNGGDFFGPTGFNEMKGKPGKVKAMPQAYDKEVARKLWEVSEKITGQAFKL